VAIARALIVNPQVIICDEVVSALDVSVQAQILNLLKDLQQQYNTAYIFISHDIGVVNYMSDRIVVMNRGSIVEMGTADQVLKSPADPYTQNLVMSSFYKR
jgi:ABC-type oligopeptide transport system ATPase subunit